ncbi:MAG: Mn2+ and Fe2+ transporters of the NRAMP family [Erysipelotrichaceae bacterium]|nr:MAG: Mn2+ and Fe2+ transporters of the NRAMP [Erysipelotrichaceae bacterium]TXT18313.1 MAG: Mn2+ and Fe2+ transporters of the NRAMP family [Erysipelotrichaceae bacterium]
MKENIKKRWTKLLYILGIIGPGIITANAGNDAGGIATYASVGAKYGYRMIWGLLLMTIGLAVVQEMNARMGVVTGKGLSDLIREKFGVKLTLFAMVILFVANFGVVLGDFAGVAASMELFGVSKYISVPLVALFIWFLVSKGSYVKVEKILMLFTFVFFGYIIAAFMVKPDWNEVAIQAITPSFDMNTGFILAFIGLVGTTITPYMQFYLQASIVDKKISLKDYKYEKLDVYIGSVWGNIVQFFIIVCTAATLYAVGIQVDSASAAALALKPLAGENAFILFGAGLFGASVLATAIIPLSTSYAICEAFGWESGVDYSVKEAPAFFGIYTFIIVIAASLVLIPNLNLMSLIISTQQIAGILTPIILIFMIMLVNDKRIMGKHTNNKIQNSIAIIAVTLIIMMTLALIVSQFL